jgi:hypothetical protein
MTHLDPRECGHHVIGDYQVRELPFTLLDSFLSICHDYRLMAEYRNYTRDYNASIRVVVRNENSSFLFHDTIE